MMMIVIISTSQSCEYSYNIVWNIKIFRYLPIFLLPFQQKNYEMNEKQRSHCNTEEKQKTLPNLEQLTLQREKSGDLQNLHLTDSGLESSLNMKYTLLIFNIWKYDQEKLK